MLVGGLLPAFAFLSHNLVVIESAGSTPEGFKYRRQYENE